MLIERLHGTKRTESLPQPIKWYEKPNLIEDLVKQHRTPSITEVKTIGVNGEEIMRNNVIIPPEGVNISTDVYDVLPNGSWEYFSQDGVSKGIAIPREVSPEVGKALQLRRDRSLTGMGSRPFPRRVSRLH